MDYKRGDNPDKPGTTDPKPAADRGDGPDDVTPEGPVAFTAKLEICDSYPTHNGPLRFTNVLVNEGAGYSPGTGIFTCPQPGLYHFTVHASTYGRAQFMIYKNGQKVVSAYHTTLDDKKSQMASIGSVIQLSKGDEVWVDLWGACRNAIFVSKDNDTVFLGFRLG
ncbi:hypothetical protein MATL_G00115970 [Megalops atlanticus]|uniref:C1q domain-containing protein n=1 Tax=Megalops atlanticus TaxID=7932 RepID=A0A9D3T4J0_MEGAT|nr:hypothetical protein MATL_G00115970 [Megalops atlanticus]